ncbi:hypothetical protein [Parapedobacter lycopersici]|uniref:hypothetical protein n=1 Tax=Parapedobacter lycopersici TaxID=1864939 RepID=UPI00214D755B|nr:hypothetical protein [Parapedobacter lycopersici]
MYDIPESIVMDALNKAIDVLIERHRELGMEATGEWISSLEARAGHNSGEIWGAHYTEQLVFGRGPGNRPPIAPLERWAKAKFGVSGKEATSMAFAVANKIASEGTTWHQKGGSDLLEVFEDPKVVETFFYQIGAYLTMTVADELTRSLKELAA